MESQPGTVTDQQIDAYHKDGAVLIPGLFKEWVGPLIAGIDRNMNEPGPHAAENLSDGESGRFFDDYCNWTRIPEFSDFVMKSPAAQAAAQLMQSARVQMFHDHVLVKEPGTAKPTPWHQDAPYYFVEGEQTLSFWVPVDPVKEASLRLLAGSHKWEKPVLPVRWLSEEDFYPSDDQYLAIPDPDAEPEKYRVLEWQMQPGDAVAFHYKSVHGARGNNTPSRRRAFSIRLVGDDARYVERPGPTSPPYAGHNMQPGQRLREDWFPFIWNG
ncbi:MAG: phytanoyl-CoA dioxygenase family protein [Rhodospirillales bacterium]|nr:phytanoyl-CoA dioxygenase family protein [Rhodospirillales bacterium]